MITKETTIYICEYCRKVYQRKNACIKHEKWCWHNPDNKRACTDCIHLKSTKTEVYFDTWQGESCEMRKVLYCKKRCIYIIPLNAERKGNAYELEDENINMPKDCEFQELF